MLPALGYGIDSDPDELVDGSRVVTYRVGLPNSRGSPGQDYADSAGKQRYKTGPALEISNFFDKIFMRNR